jgi:aspartate aminotransferase-like enzyme
MVDPNDLLEYLFIFTKPSLNHISILFQGVMRDISATLKEISNANSVVIVPGGGALAMETVARQFATNKKALVVRNRWLSFRWAQFFDMINIPIPSTVMEGRSVKSVSQSAFAPASIEEFIININVEKPDFVFTTNVKTSASMTLPDVYIKAVHKNGGIFVLDCIVPGAL